MAAAQTEGRIEDFFAARSSKTPLTCPAHTLSSHPPLPTHPTPSHPTRVDRRSKQLSLMPNLS